MPAKTITAIMMAALPTKTEYVVGFEGLDLTGGLLNLVYSDGTFEQVPLSGEMSYFVDNSAIGQTNVTVRYAGCQTGFRIQVREPVLSKVTIISPPTKTTYTEGEMLDLTGLRLMGHYDNGAEVEISPVPALSHQVQFGEAVVPLPLEHLLIPILIQVLPSRPISIGIRNMPKKTTYIERLEGLDVSGGMLEKRLTNGRVELVPLTEDMVRGFDNTKIGKQQLTASYGGQTCSFEVEVVARRCDCLELCSLPHKRNYIEGEPFDLTGIKLLAKKDSLSWEPTLSELTTKEPAAIAGCFNMEVCYQDQTISVPVTIIDKRLTGISIHTLPNKVSYKEVEGVETIIDPTGGLLALQFDNGMSETIPLSAANIEQIPSGKVGLLHLTVQYQGFKTSLEVSVEPKKLLGIYISQPPTKTSYTTGESFDAAGMEVTALYDNGQTAAIDRYTYSVSPLTKTDTTVIITYIDKTAVIPITVKEKSLTPIKLQRRTPFALPKAERFYPGTVALRFE